MDRRACGSPEAGHRRPAEHHAVIGVVTAEEHGATGITRGAVTGARELERTVDRLRAGEGKQHARVRDRLQFHQQIGEALLSGVREAGERVVGGHLLHLSGDGVRDLTAPVPHRAVPQRRGHPGRRVRWSPTVGNLRLARFRGSRRPRGPALQTDEAPAEQSSTNLYLSGGRPSQLILPTLDRLWEALPRRSVHGDVQGDADLDEAANAAFVTPAASCRSRAMRTVRDAAFETMRRFGLTTIFGNPDRPRSRS